MMKRRPFLVMLVLVAILVGPPPSADEGPRWVGEWERIETQLMPPSGQAFCMVYDEARSRAVLFGGVSPGTDGNVWEWDGQLWHEIEPATEGPEECLAGEMYYDHGLDSVVVLSIRGDPTDEPMGTIERWAWGGEDWYLATTTKQDIWPHRTGLVTLYDEARNDVLIYGGAFFGATDDGPAGGCTESQFPVQILGDTWILEEDADRWWLFDPECVTPGARLFPHMFFDHMRQSVILNGGITVESPSEMWEWDGEWNPLPGTSFREIVIDASGYDTRRGMEVVFDGVLVEDGKFLDEGEDERPGLWGWNGDRWREIETVGEIPEWRSYVSMVYDTARDEFIIFGGRTVLDEQAQAGSPTTNEMWRLRIGNPQSHCGCQCE